MNALYPPGRNSLRRGVVAVLLLLLAGVLIMQTTSSAQNSTGSSWSQLASLPDPIGYGGMIAGVIQGELIAGGGSQWDKPIWAKGTRLLSDRIFVLPSVHGVWHEHTSRLPLKAGHFATAAAPDAIYFAGGLGVDGPLRAAFKLQAKAAELVSTALPDLPETVVYGAGVIHRDRFFVIGGLPDSSAKPASRSVWSLGLAADEKAWRREADLPIGLFVATAASTDDALFVFGGMSHDSDGKAVPSRSTWRWQGKEWTKMADLPMARVGATGPCPNVGGGRILLAGGYAEIFGGAQREHPGFPAETFVYDSTANRWTSGPSLLSTPAADRDSAGDPGPAPMIGAPAVVWADRVVVISGEVRIATRSPAVVALRLPLSP